MQKHFIICILKRNLTEMPPVRKLSSFKVTAESNESKINAMIKPVRLVVDRCIGIQYTQNNNSFIILNVFTPYESFENEEEYLSSLAFINAFIQDNDT